MTMRALAVLLLPLALQAELPPGIDASLLDGAPGAVAAACADKAWVLNHKEGRQLALYGAAYLAAGDRNRAEDAFRRAADASPWDAEAFSIIAGAWLRQGEKARALAAVEAMRKADPKAAHTFAQCAAQLLEAGLESEALALAAQAGRQAPRDWKLALDFGRAALRCGRASIARDWFLKALELRPRDERVWTALAQAYAEAARTAKGARP